MDTDRFTFDCMDDHQPANGSGSKSLTDEEVERLGELQEEFAERTRNSVSDNERSAVQDDIQKRLVQEGNPWADVWAHAAAHGHTRRDAKYRVMVDWFNNWVRKAENSKPFGQFSDLQLLDSGAFGAVFRGYDNKRKGLVAIKLPHVPKKNMPSDWDTVSTSAQQHANFFEEARKHANITVPGCVAIYESCMPDSFDIDHILVHLRTTPIWFSMQFIEGKSLDDVLRKTPGGYKRSETITDDHVIELMTKIAKSLQNLHATQSPNGKGCIIHKDLKPANILLDKQNNPWLTDFGLASARFDQQVAGNPFSGTKAYAAPEQFSGIEANEQTDIWAWGVIFYELLTGQLPFDGEQRIRNEESPVPKLGAARPELPKCLESMIDKCLQRKRDDRYSNFANVLNDLRSVTHQHREFRSLPVISVLLVVVMLLLAIIGGGVWWNAFQQPLHMAQVLDNSTQKFAEEVVKQQFAADPKLMRANLLMQLTAIYEREMAEVEAITDWERRKTAKFELEASFADRRRYIETIAGGVSSLRSGNVTSEDREQNRVLQEQGIEAALRYTKEHETPLLAKVREQSRITREQNRRDLAPLLKGAQLQMVIGDCAGARARSEELLAFDETWGEVRDVHFTALTRLAQLALYGGRNAEAAILFEAVEKTSRRSVEIAPEDVRAERSLAVSIGLKGDFQHRAGRLKDARVSFEEANRILEALANAHPKDVEIQHKFAISCERVGRTYYNEGELRTADSYYQKGRLKLLILVQQEPHNTDAQYSLACQYERLGDLSLDLSKLDSAEEYFREQNQILQKIELNGGGSIYVQLSILACDVRLAKVSMQLGSKKEAITRIKAAIEGYSALARRYPDFAMVNENHSDALATAGDVYFWFKDYSSAVNFYRQAQENLARHTDSEQTNMLARRYGAVSLKAEGLGLAQEGDVTSAIQKFRAALSKVEEMEAAGHFVKWCGEERNRLNVYIGFFSIK